MKPIKLRELETYKDQFLLVKETEFLTGRLPLLLEMKSQVLEKPLVVIVSWTGIKVLLHRLAKFVLDPVWFPARWSVKCWLLRAGGLRGPLPAAVPVAIFVPP